MTGSGGRATPSETEGRLQDESDAETEFCNGETREKRERKN